VHIPVTSVALGASVDIPVTSSSTAETTATAAATAGTSSSSSSSPGHSQSINAINATSVDVVVVGGGLTGMSCAYHLLKLGFSNTLSVFYSLFSALCSLLKLT
jgi:NADPH-dependent glutamate synthase beta subunit-like oxidoreductase